MSFYIFILFSVIVDIDCSPGRIHSDVGDKTLLMSLGYYLRSVIEVGRPTLSVSAMAVL